MAETSISSGYEGFCPDKCRRTAVEVAVSERFRDESGQVLAWRLEPISAADVQAVYREGVTSGGAGLRLLAASVSYPDLRAAELQDAYGVMGAEQLLLKLLSPGEFAKLEKAFVELNM